MIGLVGARCAREDGAGLLEVWSITCVSFDDEALRAEAYRAVDWLPDDVIVSKRPPPVGGRTRYLFIEYHAEEPMDGYRARTVFYDGHTSIILGPAWARLTFAAARENLVRHELLHALSFEHSNNPLSLMHPKVGWWPVRRGLLPGEREELRRCYG